MALPPLKPCLGVPGRHPCRTLTTETRCGSCDKQVGTKQGTTAQRGYGAKHQALRRQLLRSAYGQLCPRCLEPMLPGQALDLGHRDDRKGYSGMEHAACNRGKKGSGAGGQVAT